jgi:hypothetical protein
MDHIDRSGTDYLKRSLNEDIINFCKQVNYYDYEEVAEFTLNYGDNLGYFIKNGR